MSEEIYLRKYDTITNNVIAYTPNNTLYLFSRRKHAIVMHCKVTFLQFIKRSNNLKQKTNNKFQYLMDLESKQQPVSTL